MAQDIASTGSAEWAPPDLQRLRARLRDAAADAREATASARDLQVHLDNLAENLVAMAAIVERVRRGGDGR